MKGRFAALGLAVFLAISPIVSHAQHGGIAPPPSGSPAMADMAQRHARMLDQSKRAEETLSALVAKMNAETGVAKQDAIAAVVAELARRHLAMQEQMRHMHDMMSARTEHGAGAKGDDKKAHKH